MTTKQQPQGKGEMRCEMCFKKLEEEDISIGCHRGGKMSKIQVNQKQQPNNNHNKEKKKKKKKI